MKEIFLDYPGVPNVITNVLVGGSQEGQSAVRERGLRRGWSDTRKEP